MDTALILTCLGIMLKGMIGIFVVIIAIWGLVALLNYLTSDDTAVKKKIPSGCECAEPVKTDIRQIPPDVGKRYIRGNYYEKRNYTHVQELLPGIKVMIEEGKSQREGAEYFGLQVRRKGWPA